MTQPTIDVDAVVREVLRRLTESSDATSATHATKTANVAGTANSTNVASDPSDAWRLNERLLTVATLARRPAGVRRVIVPKGAVVTPAARDELRAAKIELSYGAAMAGTPAASATTNDKQEKLYLHATNDGSPPTAGVVRLLSRVTRTVETLVPAPLPQAVAELAAVVAQPRNVAVLVTRHGDAALCLANRHREVRAVAGRDKTSVRTAIKNLGANLLVLDPSRLSQFSLASLAETFAATGPRSAPQEWNG